MASEYGYTIDQFLDLTMKQASALMEKIFIRRTKDRYYLFAFFAKLHGGEMPPLESLLGVGSEEEAFDEKTDKMLDEYAKRRLEREQALKSV